MVNNDYSVKVSPSFTTLNLPKAISELFLVLTWLPWANEAYPSELQLTPPAWLYSPPELVSPPSACE